MKIEQHYDFRKELNEVHKPNRRNPQAVPAKNEVVVDDSWSIVIGTNPGPVITCAAKDLQDYFQTSMNIMLPLRAKVAKGPALVLTVKKDAGKKRSYRFDVTDRAISIRGTDPEGVGQGCYYVEDLMNLREAPFLVKTSIFRSPVFAPRMVHSGWGLDQFPDSHLNAIAHAGFDSILLFVKGPQCTTHGFMDFNDLIDRCEKYGLGVYFYSYLNSFKSPFDADAAEFFDRNYGSVFKSSPKAKGLILVGESCYFPTRDNRAQAGMPSRSNPNADNEGIADPRPLSGYWPCKDYPDWLNAVKKAVYKYSPQADIVFWSYNWGKAPEKDRVRLIHDLPKDISHLATFEMWEVHKKYPNHQAVQPDYSITYPGPGFYFTSEAKAAKKAGLRLYTMANTAGMTWDCGMIPYVPVPQQWFRRFNAMLDANKKWGLAGVMDSHHYGWYPSPVCECAKWSFWAPKVDLNSVLYRIAVRDFGQAAAGDVVKAWQCWSDGMNSYTPGFDDQAGPLRIGPAYPFVFHPILYPHTEQHMVFPTRPQSPVGARWLHAFYNPEHIYNMTNCGRRVPEDIKIMTAALKKWEKGVQFMHKALARVPAAKRAKASKQAGVGEFFYHTLITMVHMKRWWLLNKRLEIEYDFKAAGKIMDEMEAIVAAELENAEATLPLVEADSRLGWEPSMDYMCDPSHIRWKIRQLTNLRDTTLRIYRQSLCKRPKMKR